MKLQNGESFTGVYLGYAVGPNRFDPDKESVTYKFRYEDSEKNVYWNCGRTDVALMISKIKPGKMIRITRKGTDMKDTSYTIAPVESEVSSFDPDKGDAQE